MAFFSLKQWKKIYWIKKIIIKKAIENLIIYVHTIDLLFTVFEQLENRKSFECKIFKNKQKKWK